MPKNIFLKPIKYLKNRIFGICCLLKGFPVQIDEIFTAVRINMRNFLYHRRPMLVVDVLEKISVNCVEVSVAIRSDMPFVGENGYFDPAGYMELMAQSAAPLVLLGENGRLRNISAAYLVGGRNIKISGGASAGDLLRIGLSKKESYGKYFVFEGTVKRDAECLAAGEITLWAER